jgi:hypothetical protein
VTTRNPRRDRDAGEAAEEALEPAAAYDERREYDDRRER